MTSFQISLTPKRRAAARFVVRVRRALQKALADERTAGRLNQSDLAKELGVHRSEVSRELSGKRSIGVGRVAELAWAMGYEPHFELRRPQPQPGQNHAQPLLAEKPVQAKQNASDINELLQLETA